ncbi:ABC transporter [Carnobacterium maltaromaticum]|uniref:ABC transporter ATP-binding protein n=1 Tax=Carnobacterium maltaromaticum TaxID=2751 RepID=UPI000C75ACBE|nr:ABC transporter ATP-binding protein [Carnobacterium maltaromaticum]PLS39295.1 ABC transporter [Carnobacterium maltaromaticum]PLS40104.1 ABC transporter [Carnobacterium maltaromaticum]PLS40441.1 ABC transporter [Carnobacterium maltaromaticum]PLS46084.1 ABC transporter [Carnobacterium maltaromaticum]PLS47236.1 ABC transporter [Carnobacterium maltaromaticum]
MITAKNVGYWYDKGNIPLYQHVNLTFEKGVLYSILGSSGSGKTTFLSLLAGLEKPKEGEILYEGTSISKIGLTKFRNQKVSIVFQAYNLLPYMTALQNIVTAMEITRSKETDKKAYALKMLKKVGISEDLANKNVMKLSGGQQQRIAIVRAMCTDTELIVADEPTGNLDEETSRDIIHLFQELAHKENKCIILVTHEKEVANESDVCIQLKNKEFITII